MKFTEELKTEWLKDLRSGKYVQIKHSYRSNRGHCCLAVLEETNSRLYGDRKDGMSVLEDCGLLKKVGKLANTNDGKYFDGKYTNVIPLIEKLPTV